MLLNISYNLSKLHSLIPKEVPWSRMLPFLVPDAITLTLNVTLIIPFSITSLSSSDMSNMILSEALSRFSARDDMSVAVIRVFED